MDGIAVRPISAVDRDWVRRFLQDRWGSERMVAHGVIYHPADLPGFLALRAGEPVGLAAYQVDGAVCEIVFIDSGTPFGGIGTALLQAVKDTARRSGCTRLWLVTTNDNLDALRFYQRRGFVLAAIRPNVLQAYRRLKPEIPLVGAHGIPLRDELELEMPLA